jgi:hypothetical protein
VESVWNSWIIVCSNHSYIYFCLSILLFIYPSIYLRLSLHISISVYLYPLSLYNILTFFLCLSLSFLYIYLSLSLSSTSDCPFTGNCVGLHSYRPFYLFLLYGWFGILYACYITYTPFHRCILLPIFIPSLSVQQTDLLICKRFGLHTLLFLPALAGLLSVGFLLLFQTILIKKNVTTIEYLSNILGHSQSDQMEMTAMMPHSQPIERNLNFPNNSHYNPDSLSSSLSTDIDPLSLADDEEFEEENPYSNGSFLSKVFLIQSKIEREKDSLLVRRTNTVQPLDPEAGISLSSSSSLSPPYQSKPIKSFQSLILQGKHWSSLLIPPKVPLKIKGFFLCFLIILSAIYNFS